LRLFCAILAGIPAFSLATWLNVSGVTTAWCSAVGWGLFLLVLISARLTMPKEDDNLFRGKLK